jgi:hypothetical protein
MKEQFDNAIDIIKQQPIRGCITGSILLGFFPERQQDVDVFVYDNSSFNFMFYKMYFSNQFVPLDEKEQKKIDRYIKGDDLGFYKIGVKSIKFLYNTCVPINLCIKKERGGKSRVIDSAAQVLRSFDMDVVCQAYDILSKNTLDLTKDSLKTGIVSWNTWNEDYYSENIWNSVRFFRQMERFIKYHGRVTYGGVVLNTDLVAKKHIELIDKIQDYDNIHDNENVEKLKENTKIIKQVCIDWLNTHIFTEDQRAILSTVDI